MSEVYEKFAKEEIFPDVINPFDSTASLRIVFPKSKQEVKLGNEIPVPESQEQPDVFVQLESVISKTSYTLVMTDPDAPSRTDKTYSEFAHYLVTDIELDGSKIGEWQKIDFAKARTILPYYGPGPPKGTGLHRYVFLLFQKTDPSTTVNGPSVDNRINWGYGRPGAGVRDWLANLPLDPIGGNFFFAQQK